jgi:hypothetical protein
MTPNPAGFRQVEDGVLDGYEIKALASDGESAVAVSYEGGIFYSRDGTAWEKVADTDINFNAVTYGEGYYFAGGEEGGAAFSVDGKKWNTGVVIPMSPKDIYGVAAGKIMGRSVFVAVGNDGRIAYSIGGPQGKWDKGNFSPFGEVDNAGETIRAVTYGVVNGAGVFVAVGDDGKVAFTNDLSGKWSGARSGSSWTFYDVAFGNDKFVAVGENGMVKYCADPAATYNWTAGNSKIFGSISLVGIAFNPFKEIFVVFGEQKAVGYSDYAHSWTAASFQNAFNKDISAAVSINSRIILAGSDGTILYSN